MTCDDCGVERWKIHRHHIVPKSQGGSDESPNVVRICANCHEDRHGGPRTDSLPWQLSQTPEAQAKRRITMLVRWADPLYRERVAAARTKANTPEVRAKRTAGVRRWYAVPENRAKVTAIQRENAAKPERNAKLSATLQAKAEERSEQYKRMWADPVFHERQARAMQAGRKPITASPVPA